MTITMNRRFIETAATTPSAPRLRLAPSGSRHTLLDGGWWPRSRDPIAELPELVLAIDPLRGPVIRLMLGTSGWDSHPSRLQVANRVVRLDYFTSQPDSLLTALCDRGNRVDVLVVAPGTEPGTAAAAMTVAATVGNLVHAQHILGAVTRSSDPSRVRESAAEDSVWEDDGGRLAPAKPGRPAQRPASRA